MSPLPHRSHDVHGSLYISIHGAAVEQRIESIICQIDIKLAELVQDFAYVRLRSVRACDSEYRILPNKSIKG